MIGIQGYTIVAEKVQAVTPVKKASNEDGFLRYRFDIILLGSIVAIDSLDKKQAEALKEEFLEELEIELSGTPLVRVIKEEDYL